jgi:hypothetical protein
MRGFLRHLKEPTMNEPHQVMQEALRPFRPMTTAEREALAQIDARQRAEDQRRLQRAVQDQQQYLQSLGQLS